MTPMKAIKAKCLDCCAGQAQEVKLCEFKDCALYNFRLGHNPNIVKRELTEEQKQERSIRMKAMLAKRMENGATNEKNEE